MRLGAGCPPLARVRGFAHVRCMYSLCACVSQVASTVDVGPLTGVDGPGTVMLYVLCATFVVVCFARGSELVLFVILNRSLLTMTNMVPGVPTTAEVGPRGSHLVATNREVDRCSNLCACSPVVLVADVAQQHSLEQSQRMDSSTSRRELARPSPF